ncbi:MAG: hypothetical protein WA991_03870 [Ornithinimicrobium sp.]
MGFLEDWDLSYDEINELLTDNPSLRSFVMGYAAEVKCRRMYFDSHPDISEVMKYDDHDRAKKGDIAFKFKGHWFTVEVKSIQSNSMRPKRDGSVRPNFQCDASDRRVVSFKDGSSVNTTCLLVGEFDLLAVNLHSFYGEWEFAFARNDALPRVSGRRGAAKHYTQYQRDNLLATLMPMNEPPIAPYVDDPFLLLDELISERELGIEPDLDDEVSTISSTKG